MSAFFCVGISFPTRLPWCPRFGDRVRHKSHQQTTEKNQVFFFFWWIFFIIFTEGMSWNDHKVGQLGEAFVMFHKGRLFSSDFPSRVMRTKTFQTFPLAPQTVLWLQLKEMFLSLKIPFKNNSHRVLETSIYATTKYVILLKILWDWWYLSLILIHRITTGSGDCWTK